MTNAAPLTHADGSPTRALVVDDEPSCSPSCSPMALRYEGWDVRTAGDGTEAVRAARDFRPDVVVLDVMLPDMDGLEVLRRLRADDPDVPVLFLTARDARRGPHRRAHRRRRRLRHQALQPRGGRRPAPRPAAPHAAAAVRRRRACSSSAT